MEAYPDTLDTDTAAQLLSSLCPDFIKNNSEVALGSPESFACLLFTQQELLKDVERSRANGNFDDVWECCLKLARPDRNTSNSQLHYVTVLLDEISSNLRSLVNGRMQSPYWSLKPTTLADVFTFDLDSLVDRRGIPRMLFHDLGSFQLDPTLRQRVADVFHTHQNTFLVNASGTGKTRLLYEGLCKHWGLYLTACTDWVEAQTLDLTLTGGMRNGNIVRRLPKSSALSFGMILDKNREIAIHQFSMALLVHLLIFRDFLKTATSEFGRVKEDLRPRWLLAQVWERSLRECGIYTSLLHIFRLESPAYIKESLVKVMQEVRVLLPEVIKTEGLFIVIDEANVALQEVWRSHPDDPETYPVLKELINVWTKQLTSLDVPITFVVSGTEIPVHYFPPSSPQWATWKWTSNTGAFDDPDLHRNYLSSFLSPEYMETASGRALVKRVWNWCRLRHRLTDSFIAMLIGDKCVHPHATLNRYIKGLTSYEAHDGDEFAVTEGRCKISPLFVGIGKIVRFSPRVQFTVHEVIFHYIIAGKHPPYFDFSKVELVTSGVGQFIDTDMKVIALNQPGPIIASATWLCRCKRCPEPHSLTSFEDFCSYYQDRWPDGDTYDASNYIAFYLAHAFTNGRALGDVFTVPSLPPWLTASSKPANLVILQKDKKGDIHETILRPSALLPTAPPLGFAASTVDDVLAWLNHEHFGAFCLCPSSCGAELIFVLRFNQKNIWVLLRTTGRGMQTPPDIDFYREFGHLAIKGLFPSPDPRSLPDRLVTAFDSLPNSVETRGSLSILRVLASFPSEPLLTCDVAQRIKGPTVATMNVKIFESVTKAVIGADVVESFICSIQDRRDSFTDENPAFQGGASVTCNSVSEPGQKREIFYGYWPMRARSPSS